MFDKKFRVVLCPSNQILATPLLVIQCVRQIWSVWLTCFIQTPIIASFVVKFIDIQKNNWELECGPMPNVMVALPNIGGALCSTPQSLADAHYLTAVQ